MLQHRSKAVNHNDSFKAAALNDAQALRVSYWQIVTAHAQRVCCAIVRGGDVSDTLCPAVAAEHYHSASAEYRRRALKRKQLRAFYNNSKLAPSGRFLWHVSKGPG